MRDGKKFNGERGGHGVDECFTLGGLVLPFFFFFNFEIILVLQKRYQNSRVPPASPSVNLLSNHSTMTHIKKLGSAINETTDFIPTSSVF